MSKNLISVSGIPMMTTIPDPSKSIATTSATSVTIDTTNDVVVKVNAVSACTYYFNSDTTKTFPIAAGVDTEIMVAHSKTLGLTILNASATAVYIQRS